MKKILIIVVSLFFTFSNYAQENNPLVNRKQISPRLNLSISPFIEYVKVAGNYNIAGGVSLLAEINDKFYYGVYFTKKLQKDYISFVNVNEDLNFSYQHLGLTVGGFVNLGIYKDEGRYIKRKTRLVYSGNFGGGVFWTKNNEDVKQSSRDYLYVLQPSVGAMREMGKFISLEAGLKYPIAFKVNGEWEALDITNKDFTGPAVYLAFKYSLFR